MDHKKPQSLAEYLGVGATPDQDPPVSAPPGKVSAKAFCQGILHSPEFRRYLLNGITLGDLPPAVVLRVMDVGWGKPVERIEMKETAAPLEAISAEQLERRALFLATMARRLRNAQENPPDHEGKVH